MRIADMLNQIVAACDGYAKTGNPSGGAFVVTDLVHLWQSVLQQTDALRIMVMYNGETARVNYPGGSITRRVDARFLVVVTRGRGYALNRGDTFTKTPGGQPPLASLMEDVRNICLAQLFDPQTTERPPDYEGIIPFDTSAAGTVVDAMQIEFTVGNQLPIATSTPPDYAPPLPP
jgi:hypothetical protein